MTRRLYLNFAIAYALATAALAALIWTLQTYTDFAPSSSLGIVAFMAAIVYAGTALGAKIDAPPPSGELWKASLICTVIAVAISSVPALAVLLLEPSVEPEARAPLEELGAGVFIGVALFLFALMVLIGRWMLGTSIRNGIKAREKTQGGNPAP